MKQILFFALKGDLLPVLEAVERNGPLQYVRTGNCLSPDFDRYLHGADIPDLGRASVESAISCESFLVAPRTMPVNVTSINGIGGIRRYCMDQLINPDTVCFLPGGVWKENIILYGRVATASKSAISHGLMKQFHSEGV